MRGALERRAAGMRGCFSTTNDDDILFISAGALTNEGFFDNVGETRREGVELNIAGAAGERITWSRTTPTSMRRSARRSSVPSLNNPESVDGEIAVEVGDRLPLIPEHLLKTGVRFAATDNFTFGADLYVSSSQFFRGDEGNLAEEIDGYALLDLRGSTASATARACSPTSTTCSTRNTRRSACSAKPTTCSATTSRIRSSSGPARRARWIGVRIEF